MIHKADWKQLYLRAICESDRDTLPLRILKAQLALRSRLVELKNIDDIKERVQIKDALRMLNLLRQKG